MTGQLQVQIFGIKNSHAVRAAERFFKERGVQVHFVDLKQKPMSAGEFAKFIQKFGLAQLIDSSSKPYIDGGLQYMKLSESDWLAKIAGDPRLLRMPLVRCGKTLCIGEDLEGWKASIVR